uniref:Uncharacterized protein n=1 Tax=Anguilla anguilla TaxID=7936 RepID=A0A0E9RY12_ANGAN
MSEFVYGYILTLTILCTTVVNFVCSSVGGKQITVFMYDLNWYDINTCTA